MSLSLFAALGLLLSAANGAQTVEVNPPPGLIPDDGFRPVFTTSVNHDISPGIFVRSLDFSDFGGLGTAHCGVNNTARTAKSLPGRSGLQAVHTALLSSGADYEVDRRSTDSPPPTAVPERSTIALAFLGIVSSGILWRQRP